MQHPSDFVTRYPSDVFQFVEAGHHHMKLFREKLFFFWEVDSFVIMIIKFKAMKKLLFILALLCALYSCKGHRGHEWVDLGLSVKWATCNVGASSPEEYGDYFAWGDTSPKSEYRSDNCASYRKSWSDIGGNSSRDAATANWGGNWRLPTKAEFQELIDNCDWTRTTQNGHKGYKVTSKKNGNSIFLPAACYRYGSELHYDYLFTDGAYWSSEPFESGNYHACYLGFCEDGYGMRATFRDHGHSVRPVMQD